MSLISGRFRMYRPRKKRSWRTGRGWRRIERRPTSMRPSKPRPPLLSQIFPLRRNQMLLSQLHRTFQVWFHNKQQAATLRHIFRSQHHYCLKHQPLFAQGRLLSKILIIHLLKLLYRPLRVLLRPRVRPPRPPTSQYHLLLRQDPNRRIFRKINRPAASRQSVVLRVHLRNPLDSRDPQL